MTLLLEEGLHGFLVDLGTDAAGRVTPQRLPQNPAFPALTYNTVSGVREYDHSGQGNIDARVDVHCWDRSYLAAKRLARDVAQGLSGFRGEFVQGGDLIKIGKVMVQNEMDLYEPETQIHHVALDIGLGYTE